MLSHEKFHEIIEKVIINQDGTAEREFKQLLSEEGIQCAPEIALKTGAVITAMVMALEDHDDNEKAEVAIVNLFAIAFTAGYIGGREETLESLEAGEAAINELNPIPPDERMPGNYI